MSSNTSNLILPCFILIFLVFQINSILVTPLFNEFMVNDEKTNHQKQPDVAVLNSGRYVVCWESLNSVGGQDIYAQLFSQEKIKIGSEFLVNQEYTNVVQERCKITPLTNNGFVIFWRDFLNTGRNPYRQVYDSDGQRVGVNIAFTEHSYSHIGLHSVDTLMNGQIILIFSSQTQVPPRMNQDNLVVGVLLDSTGLNVVKKDIYLHQDDTTYKLLPSVAKLTDHSNDGFVSIWEEYKNNYLKSDKWVTGRIFANGGKGQTNEVKVNQVNSMYQRKPIVKSGDGIFVVMWYSDENYVFKVFKSDDFSSVKDNDIKIGGGEIIDSVKWTGSMKVTSSNVLFVAIQTRDSKSFYCEVYGIQLKDEKVEQLLVIDELSHYVDNAGYKECWPSFPSVSFDHLKNEIITVWESYECESSLNGDNTDIYFRGFKLLCTDDFDCNDRGNCTDDKCICNDEYSGFFCEKEGNNDVQWGKIISSVLGSMVGIICICIILIGLLCIFFNFHKKGKKSKPLSSLEIENFEMTSKSEIEDTSKCEENI